MESVTVAVVSIYGVAHLKRCLGALAGQVGAPEFETVVAFDPWLKDVTALREQFPLVCMVANEGQHSPLELASGSIRESAGELVLLTEDHCVPQPDWIRRLCDAQHPGRAAVGGTVESNADAYSVDWAFYFEDFFQYAAPVSAGLSPTLTVCNVSYWINCLGDIRSVWEDFFHETVVNDVLRERFSELHIIPEARMKMSCHVRFVEAVRERHAFGRLFGCTRLQFVGRKRRVYYSVFALVLPVLLLGCLAWATLGSRRFWRPFISAFPAMIVMVMAWSWGEWLDYLTCRRPCSLDVAQEVGL